MYYLFCIILQLTAAFKIWEPLGKLESLHMWAFKSYFSFIVSLLIQNGKFAKLSLTIKTEQKQGLSDLNHGFWQWFSIHQLSSVGNLTQAWCRNGLGLTLIFCLYCKNKGLAPVQHPGEIPCTLLSTNLAGRLHYTSSSFPFQVTLLKDTDIWHVLYLEIFRSEMPLAHTKYIAFLFLPLGKMMAH